MSLESRYRRLISAYPPEYRAEREDEMIDTLLERAGTDQTKPTISEAWDLIRNGIAVRAASNGSESRRTGRVYASLVACSVSSMVITLVMALWMSGFYPSISDAEFVALWSPFALMVFWYVAQRGVLARLGWVLVAGCLVGVIVGPDRTMAQRSLVAALTVLGIVMVTAPIPSSSAGPKLISRLTAMLVGVAAGTAMAVRYNLRFDYLTDRGATVLWGVLPHPPSALIPAIIAVAIISLVACLFRPALAIAVGILVVPVGVIGFMLSSDAFFFTLNRRQALEALLACAVGSGLVIYGTVTSMRTRRTTPLPGHG